MAFRSRLALAEPFETWPLMELAAEQRYWDGLNLAMGEKGCETGALYLLGYVAEMLLKTAYFRINSISPSDNIAPHLRTANQHSRWRGGNLHNLRSWFYLLDDVRTYRGNPWSPVLVATVERHVLTVDAHWRESLRYTSVAANDAELEETFASVDWLLANYNVLWR